MKKIFNGMFFGLKFILLVAAFALTLFIMLRMNLRLNKPVTTLIPTLVPFLVLLIIFIVNIIFKQSGVNKNIFYNLTCFLSLLTIVLVSLRALFETNMVLNAKYGYGIDFNFFSNFISYIKIILYGLIVCDILFMFKEKDKVNIKKK